MIWGGGTPAPARTYRQDATLTWFQDRLMTVLLTDTTGYIYAVPGLRHIALWPGTWLWLSCFWQRCCTIPVPYIYSAQRARVGQLNILWSKHIYFIYVVTTTFPPVFTFQRPRWTSEMIFFFNSCARIFDIHKSMYYHTEYTKQKNLQNSYKVNISWIDPGDVFFFFLQTTM